ncbi:sugar phosphate nucleotidyltransferase, partial [Xanthovirga aplysinae]|uniref:phosphocholine cytidylyltransferase family protein n=1 Tax=Xanthovirga aplysinae TaxID=2529853 RepID=UPI0012BCEC4D
FILAAGKGTRLMPLTKNTPKSLLELGDGTTLLERQISNAVQSKLFSEIVILTGYKHEQIDAKVKEYKEEIKISTIYNPFFDTTNNLVSLWLANHLMLESDFVITNGDNIYKDHVYREVLDGLPQELIQVTIDYKTTFDDDDMKVVLQEDSTIVKIHKEIPLEDADAESVGLAVVKGAKSRRLFSQKLVEMVKDTENMGIYWLVIFNSLVHDGIIVNTKEIAETDWQEMDFHPDIESLRKIVFKEF